MLMVLVALMLAFVAPVTGLAQTAELAAGARIRVTSPREGLKKTVATVTETRGDSITVALSSGSRVIAHSDITALDVSRGKRSRFLMDSAIGLGLGVTAGGLAGAVTYKECDDTGFLDCFLEPDNRGESAAWGAVLGGAVGFTAGAIVGLFHRTDRWEGTTLPVRAAIRPSSAGRVTLVVSRAF